MTDPIPVRLGLVGLGMAGGVMAVSARSHPEIRVVSAADPNPELRARFERDEDLPAYDDVSGILASPEVDAVYIATPHQLHRDHVVAAVRAGKHVVVEKPMALSVVDCDDMIAAAEDNGVTLIVGHTHSFDPAVQVMRDVIADGRLGRLAMIAQWNYTDFLYRPRRPEELDTSRGGGILFNQIPHQVDIARFLAGASVRSVRATTAVLDSERPTEGACAALLEFADGVVASLVYSGYDYFDSDETHQWINEGGYPKTPAHGRARRSLPTVGAEREIEARWRDFGYGKISVDAPPHQPHFGELIVTCEGGDMRPGADEVLVYAADGASTIRIPTREWRPGRGDVLQELLDAVRGQRRPQHDGPFGRATVATCLAIAQSGRERREIQVDEPAKARCF
jgi:phthalate 4,5-cis-dihydrodiol dehydrogenase